MPIPTDITFKNIPSSEWIKDRIMEKMEALERFYRRISRCRVLIGIPHKSHRSGNLFHIQVELRVPGKRILVQRHPPKRHLNEDVEVALRDAFKAVRRELEDHVRTERGFTKTHDERTRLGRVSKLFPGDGYGFIRTPEGDEVYFHEHSVARNAFPRLRVGSEVSFSDEVGEKGLQASRVKQLDQGRLLTRASDAATGAGP